MGISSTVISSPVFHTLLFSGSPYLAKGGLQHLSASLSSLFPLAHSHTSPCRFGALPCRDSRNKARSPTDTRPPPPPFPPCNLLGLSKAGRWDRAGRDEKEFPLSHLHGGQETGGNSVTRLHPHGSPRRKRAFCVLVYTGLVENCSKLHHT